jgi:hypothetical protein
VTKKTRKYAFIGLMVPGILLGTGFAGILGVTCLGEFFDNTKNWELLLSGLGNILIAALCAVAPLWIFGQAEKGSRPRKSRRIMTGIAVALAYLLPTIHLSLLIWSLQRSLGG